MKKLAIVSLIAISSAGCGKDWLPFRPFRGAPCGGSPGCLGGAPNTMPPGCPCPGTSAGFPSYESSMVGDDIIGGTHFGGEIIHDGIVVSPNGFQSRGSAVAPPMGSFRGN
jgi:hypothetical protein